jgi:hypothetical protein
MIKKTVEYDNFDGVKQTEDLYFHLSKSEIVEMHTGGIVALLNEVMTRAKATDSANANEIVALFKKLIGMAYGVKSADGNRFHKDKQQTEDFLASPAYDAVFMDLLNGGDQDAIKFVLGMLPKDMADEAASIAASLSNGVKVVIPITDVPVSPNQQSIDFLTKQLSEQLPALMEANDTVPDAFKKRQKSPDEMSVDELQALIDKKRQSAG